MMICLNANCGHYMVAGVHSCLSNGMNCNKSLNPLSQYVKVPCYVCPRCGAILFPSSEAELQGWVWMYSLQMNCVTEAIWRKIEQEEKQE